MTVHVISVGLSIMESLARPSMCDPLAGARDLVSMISTAGPVRLLADHGIGVRGSDGEAASAWLASALVPEGQPGRDELRAAELGRRCAGAQPGRWPSPVSAELDTFARTTSGGAQLRRSDMVVLISSDSADGLCAGLWNAAALTGGDLRRVRYLAKPGEQLADVRGQAALVRVNGLDAASEEGFRTAMTGLGLLGRQLLDTGGVQGTEPFRFYLSGGFKAAIPYLIGFAEGLRSLDPEREVTAYVLHETTTYGPGTRTVPAPIRLPLRRILPEVIRAHLDGFTDGARRDRPSGTAALLEGYTYERDGRQWRLTAFGECLRALFGPGPEGLVR